MPSQAIPALLLQGNRFNRVIVLQKVEVAPSFLQLKRHLFFKKLPFASNIICTSIKVNVNALVLLLTPLQYFRFVTSSSVSTGAGKPLFGPTGTHVVHTEKLLETVCEAEQSIFVQLQLQYLT